MNDIISIRTESGSNARARVIRIGESFIEAEIIEIRPADGPSVDVTLCLSLLKGKSFDLAVERAVETGVSRIIPFVSQRTIPRREGSRVDRWRRKAAEAAKQSLRESVPLVDPIRHFDELVKTGFPGLMIIAHPAADRTIKEFLRVNRDDGPVHLMVGPEGGFSDDEFAAAEGAGWAGVSFGFTQLRAGTAAEILAAIIIYERGG